MNAPFSPRSHQPSEASIGNSSPLRRAPRTESVRPSRSSSPVARNVSRWVSQISRYGSGTRTVNGWPRSSCGCQPKTVVAPRLLNVIRPRPSATRIASWVASVITRKRSSAARSSCSISSIWATSRPHT